MNETNLNSNWQPNRWIAALLSLLFAPLGMFYIERKVWALGYLGLIVLIVAVRISLLPSYSNNELWWMIPSVSLISIIHVFLMAPKISEPRHWYSRWYGLIGITLALVLPILIFRVFFYETFSIPADSMAPTLQSGDLVEVKKWGCGNYRYLGVGFDQTAVSDSCKIKRGDIIVFKYPPNPQDVYIKRVVAIGGDKIYYKDRHFYINGKQVASQLLKSFDDYSIYEERLGDINYQVQFRNKAPNHPFRYTSLKVPEGYYYVLGDNRDNSADSRLWGLVPEENVIGHLAHIYR